MLRFFNTLSRRVEAFEPLDPSGVRLYACGPTVYDFAHIGNFRFNVWVDVLRRALEWYGYPVHLVMNITDVDDKTIAGARREDVPLSEYTNRYTEAFFEDLRSLRIREASVYPRATGHIDDMVRLIERLLDRGHAYRADGSVYFRVGSFEEYGRLARLDPSQLRASGRAEGEAHEKEDPRDFVLWKGAKEGEPAWETPIGRGRPGWHIECSAMSMKYLGETFDIHAGGIDLVFPHHENELAQSFAATGRQLACFWMHCEHLVVDGVKMSKSLGNQYTLRDLIEAGHDPLAIRYLLASVHYRKQLNLTFEALGQAKAAVDRYAELVLRLEQEMPGLPAPSPDPAGVDRPAAEAAGTAGSAVGVELERASRAFRQALEDDLNTSGALGHMFTLVRAAHSGLDAGEVDRGTASSVLQWLRRCDTIWGVLPTEDDLVERAVEVDGRELVAVGPRIDEEMLELVVARMQARARRDFEAADRMRDRLLAAGIELEDTPRGVRWHLASSN